MYVLCTLAVLTLHNLLRRLSEEEEGGGGRIGRLEDEERRGEGGRGPAGAWSDPTCRSRVQVRKTRTIGNVSN